MLEVGFVVPPFGAVWTPLVYVKENNRIKSNEKNKNHTE